LQYPLSVKEWKKSIAVRMLYVNIYFLLKDSDIKRFSQVFAACKRFK
jgi:hypothetical protein